VTIYQVTNFLGGETFIEGDSPLQVRASSQGLTQQDGATGSLLGPGKPRSIFGPMTARWFLEYNDEHQKANHDRKRGIDEAAPIVRPPQTTTVKSRAAPDD
jgi:hypothetical protein